MYGKWVSVSEMNYDVWCSLEGKSGVYCLSCVCRFEKKPNFSLWPKMARLCSVHLHFQKGCCFRPDSVLKPLKLHVWSVLRGQCPQGVNKPVNSSSSHLDEKVVIQSVSFLKIHWRFISVKASSSASCADERWFVVPTRWSCLRT